MVGQAVVFITRTVHHFHALWTPDLRIRYWLWWLPNEMVSVTRSSWLNCALRDDEAVYWVSIGHYEAVAVVIDDTGSEEGIYILHKVEIWSGVSLPMP